MSGDRMKNHMAASRKLGDGAIVCPGIRHADNQAKGIVSPQVKKKEQWKARKAAELAAALKEIE
jgi:orotidine-5'-phosphate decarboxylase